MFHVSDEIINKLVNYLGTKPYVEVAVLLSELQQDIQKNTKVVTAEIVKEPDAPVEGTTEPCETP